MITIAYIVSTLELAGPTHQLHNIIKYLDKKNFDSLIITLSQEPSNSLKNKFEMLKIPIIGLNLNRLKGVFFAKKKLKKIINKYNPEIIHSNGLRADRLLFKLNLKHISTIRGNFSIAYPSKYGIIGYLMAKFHINTMLKCYYPVACSKSISDHYRHKYGINMPFIQNGVDITQFYPTKDKQKIKNFLKLPSNKKIFISVGNLDFNKNIDVIISGFLHSKAKIESILLIVGDGPQIYKLKNKAKNNSEIIFIGKVNNIHEYLKASDYFISASLSEGLPNAVLEALACGLPVVLSDIAPHQEIIDLDPKAGSIFRKRDYMDLSEKINNLMEKNYMKLSVAASNMVKNDFNAITMSNKYQQLYYSICKK